MAALLRPQPAPSPDPAARAEPQGRSRGASRAAGRRRACKRTLKLGPGHEAAVFDLTGSVLLTGEQRPAVGFQARVIGFSDDRATHAGPQRLDRRARRPGLQRPEGRTDRDREPHLRHVPRRHRPLRRRDRRLQLRVEIHGRFRGRRRERAGGRPQGPGTVGRRRRLQDRAIHERRRHQPPLAAQAGAALCARARHLVHAGTGRPDERGMASLRHLRVGHLRRHPERLSAPDVRRCWPWRPRC